MVVNVSERCRHRHVMLVAAVMLVLLASVAVALYVIGGMSLVRLVAKLILAALPIAIPVIVIGIMTDLIGRHLLGH